MPTPSDRTPHLSGLGAAFSAPRPGLGDQAPIARSYAGERTTEGGSTNSPPRKASRPTPLNSAVASTLQVRIDRRPEPVNRLASTEFEISPPRACFGSGQRCVIQFRTWVATSRRCSAPTPNGRRRSRRSGERSGPAARSCLRPGGRPGGPGSGGPASGDRHAATSWRRTGRDVERPAGCRAPAGHFPAVLPLPASPASCPTARWSPRSGPCGFTSGTRLRRG